MVEDAKEGHLKYGITSKAGYSETESRLCWQQHSEQPDNIGELFNVLVFLKSEHGIIYLRGDTMIKRDEKGNIVDNPRIKDKTGQRFGRLVVKEIDLNKASRKTFWICECDCGNVVSIRSDTFRFNKIMWMFKERTRF